MKRLTAIILSIACLLAFSACAANNAGNSGNEAPVADAWGIVMEAKDVTSQGLTLTCTQKGGSAEGQLETGSAYWIEMRVEGSWVKVEPIAEPVWDMMAHVLPAGETVEWELNWTWLYGELGAGRYRICKNIVDFKESGASVSRNYCAEFELK